MRVQTVGSVARRGAKTLLIRSSRCGDRKTIHPSKGARFEVHFEKLRNRVEGDGAAPFEAKLESFVTDQGEGVRWSSRERSPPVLKQVAELFQDGLTVREVAAALKMSKTEAGRLRLRALGEGLLVAGHGGDRLGTNGHNPASWGATDRFSPIQAEEHRSSNQDP